CRHRLRRCHARPRRGGRDEVHRLLARSAREGRRRTGGTEMSIALHLSGRVKAVVDDALPGLIGDLVASRIGAGDGGLWGPDAESEAAQRLGWVDAVSVSRPLVPEILALREELLDRGVDRFVLAGMGGSSLAPEVITQTAGVPLVILD